MAEPVTSPPAREHVGGVLGVAFGLLVLGGALASLLFADLGGPIDARAELRSLFGEGEPPLGFALAEAARLPGGERVLRLAPPDGEAASESGRPEELVFVFLPSSERLVRRFDPPRPPVMGAGGPPRPGSPPPMDPGQRLVEWERDPSFAWHTTTKRDEIQWGTWRAAFAIERSMQKGGDWRECARVNLDQNFGKGEARHVILFARWPTKEPVDEGVLRRILAGVRMLERPEGA